MTKDLQPQEALNEALLKAVEEKDEGTVKDLLSQGADPSFKKDGKTVLATARDIKGNESIVGLLSAEFKRRIQERHKQSLKKAENLIQNMQDTNEKLKTRNERLKKERTEALKKSYAELESLDVYGIDLLCKNISEKPRELSQKLCDLVNLELHIAENQKLTPDNLNSAAVHKTVLAAVEKTSDPLATFKLLKELVESPGIALEVYKKELVDLNVPSQPEEVGVGNILQTSQEVRDAFERKTQQENEEIINLQQRYESLNTRVEQQFNKMQALGVSTQVYGVDKQLISDTKQTLSKNLVDAVGNPGKTKKLYEEAIEVVETVNATNGKQLERNTLRATHAALLKNANDILDTMVEVDASLAPQLQNDRKQLAGHQLYLDNVEKSGAGLEDIIADYNGSIGDIQEIIDRRSNQLEAISDELDKKISQSTRELEESLQKDTIAQEAKKIAAVCKDNADFAIATMLLPEAETTNLYNKIGELLAGKSLDDSTLKVAIGRITEKYEDLIQNGGRELKPGWENTLKAVVDHALNPQLSAPLQKVLPNIQAQPISPLEGVSHIATDEAQINASVSQLERKGAASTAIAEKITPMFKNNINYQVATAMLVAGEARQLDAKIAELLTGRPLSDETLQKIVTSIGEKAGELVQEGGIKLKAGWENTLTATINEQPHPSLTLEAKPRGSIKVEYILAAEFDNAKKAYDEALKAASKLTDGPVQKAFEVINQAREGDEISPEQGNAIKQRIHTIEERYQRAVLADFPQKPEPSNILDTIDRYNQSTRAINAYVKVEEMVGKVLEEAKSESWLQQNMAILAGYQKTSPYYSVIADEVKTVVEEYREAKQALNPDDVGGRTALNDATAEKLSQAREKYLQHDPEYTPEHETEGRLWGNKRVQETFRQAKLNNDKVRDTASNLSVAEAIKGANKAYGDEEISLHQKDALTGRLKEVNKQYVWALVADLPPEPKISEMSEATRLYNENTRVVDSYVKALDGFAKTLEEEKTQYTNIKKGLAGTFSNAAENLTNIEVSIVEATETLKKALKGERITQDQHRIFMEELGTLQQQCAAVLEERRTVQNELKPVGFYQTQLEGITSIEDRYSSLDDRISQIPSARNLVNQPVTAGELLHLTHPGNLNYAERRDALREIGKSMLPHAKYIDVQIEQVNERLEAVRAARTGYNQAKSKNGTLVTLSKKLEELNKDYPENTALAVPIIDTLVDAKRSYSSTGKYKQALETWIEEARETLRGVDISPGRETQLERQTQQEQFNLDRLEVDLFPFKPNPTKEERGKYQVRKNRIETTVDKLKNDLTADPAPDANEKIRMGRLLEGYEKIQRKIEQDKGGKPVISEETVMGYPVYALEWVKGENGKYSATTQKDADGKPIINQMFVDAIAKAYHTNDVTEGVYYEQKRASNERQKPNDPKYKLGTDAEIAERAEFDQGLKAIVAKSAEIDRSREVLTREAAKAGMPVGSEKFNQYTANVAKLVDVYMNPPSKDELNDVLYNYHLPQRGLLNHAGNERFDYPSLGQAANAFAKLSAAYRTDLNNFYAGPVDVVIKQGNGREETQKQTFGVHNQLRMRVANLEERATAYRPETQQLTIGDAFSLTFDRMGLHPNRKAEFMKVMQDSFIAHLRSHGEEKSVERLTKLDTMEKIMQAGMYLTLDGSNELFLVNGLPVVNPIIQEALDVAAITTNRAMDNIVNGQTGYVADSHSAMLRARKSEDGFMLKAVKEATFVPQAGKAFKEGNVAKGIGYSILAATMLPVYPFTLVTAAIKNKRELQGSDVPTTGLGNVLGWKHMFGGLQPESKLSKVMKKNKISEQGLANLDRHATKLLDGYLTQLTPSDKRGSDKELGKFKGEGELKLEDLMTKGKAMFGQKRSIGYGDVSKKQTWFQKKFATGLASDVITEQAHAVNKHAANAVKGALSEEWRKPFTTEISYLLSNVMIENQRQEVFAGMPREVREQRGMERFNPTTVKASGQVGEPGTFNNEAIAYLKGLTAEEKQTIHYRLGFSPQALSNYEKLGSFEQLPYEDKKELLKLVPGYQELSEPAREQLLRPITQGESEEVVNFRKKINDEVKPLFEQLCPPDVAIYLKAFAPREVKVLTTEEMQTVLNYLDRKSAYDHTRDLFVKPVEKEVAGAVKDGTIAKLMGRIEKQLEKPEDQTLLSQIKNSLVDRPDTVYLSREQARPNERGYAATLFSGIMDAETFIKESKAPKTVGGMVAYQLKDTVEKTEAEKVRHARCAQEEVIVHTTQKTHPEFAIAYKVFSTLRNGVHTSPDESIIVIAAMANVVKQTLGRYPEEERAAVIGNALGGLDAFGGDDLASTLVAGLQPAFTLSKDQQHMGIDVAKAKAGIEQVGSSWKVGKVQGGVDLDIFNQAFLEKKEELLRFKGKPEISEEAKDLVRQFSSRSLPVAAVLSDDDYQRIKNTVMSDNKELKINDNVLKTLVGEVYQVVSSKSEIAERQKVGDTADIVSRICWNVEETTSEKANGASGKERGVVLFKEEGETEAKLVAPKERQARISKIVNTRVQGSAIEI